MSRELRDYHCNTRAFGDLLGGTEDQAMELLDLCFKKATPSVSQPFCWDCEKSFLVGQPLFVDPSPTECADALANAQEAKSVVAWEMSYVYNVSKEEDLEALQRKDGIAIGFDLESVPLGGAAAIFWDNCYGGYIFSIGALVNLVCVYTALHADVCGSMTIAQLLGFGGFKIWFAFSPSHGKTLLGKDQLDKCHSKGNQWIDGVLEIARLAAECGKIFIQFPGETILLPPNSIHAVATIPCGAQGMDLLLIGRNETHPDMKTAVIKSSAWLNNYKSGNHNLTLDNDPDGLLALHLNTFRDYLPNKRSKK